MLFYIFHLILIENTGSFSPGGEYIAFSNLENLTSDVTKVYQYLTKLHIL